MRKGEGVAEIRLANNPSQTRNKKRHFNASTILRYINTERSPFRPWSRNTSKMPSLELQTRNAPPPLESSQRSSYDGENQHDIAIVEQNLAPADTGIAAWRLLVVAFVFEALLWGQLNPDLISLYQSRDGRADIDTSGFPLSFGVFQNYYSQQPQFANNPFISIVGTVASGISYLGAPLIIPVIKRYSKYQRHMIWIGCTSTQKISLKSTTFHHSLRST